MVLDAIGLADVVVNAEGNVPVPPRGGLYPSEWEARLFTVVVDVKSLTRVHKASLPSF